MSKSHYKEVMLPTLREYISEAEGRGLMARAHIKSLAQVVIAELDSIEPNDLDNAVRDSTEAYLESIENWKHRIERGALSKLKTKKEKQRR